MTDRSDFDYNFFFDEADEFAETELDYVERSEWDNLLSLYEREIDNIEDEEEASDLRKRIEAIREGAYEDAKNAQY